MSWMADLAQRRCQPEIMDQPGLDRERHIQALQGLERINRWSGSLRLVWSPLGKLARALAPKPVRVLDMACGAGDLPIGLWRKARRAGLALHVEGCDRSAQALEHARQRARARQADVSFFPLDVLKEALPSGYDALINSLFLHHLTNDEARDLLRRMAHAAGRLIVINDLRRSAVGLLLAYLGTRLFSRSEVVHVDGPRSVQAAFRVEEIQRLASQAGLEGTTVQKRWPCRFLLTWRRP